MRLPQPVATTTVRRKEKKYRLVSVFWGDAFVDTFLRIGLRSLLAEGNLPDLARKNKVIYSIYTTRDAAQRLEVEPLFQTLRSVVDVRLVLFALTEIDASNFGSHNVYWKRGIEIARRNREVLIYLIPDVIYAKGTLTRWAARFESGVRALYTPGPQAAMETLLPELEARFVPGSGPIELDADEIPSLLFKHFHPIHSLMRPGRSYQPAHPEVNFRIVPGRGIVWREFTAHPHAFEPGYFNKVEGFNPSDHLDEMHVEPCSIISLEPLLKRSYQYYRPRGQDDFRINNFGNWHDHYAGVAGVRLSALPFEIVEKKDDVWLRGRGRAVAEGRLHRANVLMSSDIFALYGSLSNRARHSLARSSEVLAVGIFLCRLRRRIPVRRKFIILAPVDSVLDPIINSEILPLLVPGRQDELFERIANHIVLPPDEENGFSTNQKSPSSLNELAGYRTVSGHPIGSMIDGVDIAAEPFDVGIFTVYPINKILCAPTAEAPVAPEPVAPEPVAPEPVAPEPVAPARPSLSSPSGSVSDLPDSFREALSLDFVESPEPANERWQRPYRGTYVVSPWVRGSKFRRLVFAALHVPILESLVALFYPVYFKSELKPAVGVFVNSVNGLRVAVRHLWRALLWPFMMVISLYRQMLSLGHQVLSLGHQVLSLGHQVLLLGPRVLRAIKRRIVTTEQKAPEIVVEEPPPEPAPIAPDVPLHSDHVELLDQLRQVRVLESVNNLLAEFEQAYGAAPSHSAPLALVREILERENVAGDHGRIAVESALIDLTKIYPNCAEAWLELAFLRQDQGWTTRAVDCFQRAVAGKPYQDVGPFFHDPRNIAAAHLSEILFAQGRRDEGLEACAGIFERDHNAPFTMMGLRYGLELCVIGECGRAWPHLCRAMTYEEYHWRVPSLRDLRTLDLSRLAEYAAMPSATGTK